MKANEAPENIYFSANENGTHYYTEGIPFEREYIEYIRTDAFIKKACEWLQNHNNYLRIHDNGRGVRFDMTQCVIDFRKALKGE